MFVPFISARQNNEKLGKRKGGGGGGRGGGGSTGGGKGSSGSSGSSAGKGGGSSSSSSSSSKSSWSSWSGGSTSTSKNAPRPYSNGGGAVSTISSGSFAGRTSGGGTRGSIYGNSVYGSGYPGISGRGVAGRGFPFVFWPLAFGGIGSSAYLYNNEYGLPDNTSRPGGAQMTAAFKSNNADLNTIFRIVSDNNTVVELIDQINTNCSSRLTTTSTTAAAFSLDLVKPEQIVQYYRASSVALTVDGYNNSAVFSSDENAPQTPLPSVLDTSLLECLNATIGNAVPLVDGAFGSGDARVNMGSVALAWMFFWWIRNTF